MKLHCGDDMDIKIMFEGLKIEDVYNFREKYLLNNEIYERGKTFIAMGR